MDDLTKEFLAESREALDRMEACLTELEHRPKDTELLAEIFRAVHTMKGSTGFLGFGRLEKLSHAGEHLMSRLREGSLRISAEVLDGLLRLTDGLRAILTLIDTTGGEGSRAQDQDEALLHLLEGLASGRETAPLTETSAPPTLTAEVSDGTIRLDVDVLNRMMTLVGELVQTRNQIVGSSVEGERFDRMAQRLDTVTVELRETVMRARLQPVGELFRKFPRMVRVVAQSCGRAVRLECSGHETALDRSLLESLKDPLMHAIRNAIDHGIEPADQRRKAGKSAEGRVRLLASHENGHVIIEVEDDGAGMDPGRILARAVERGLVTPEQAVCLSAQEILQFVFLPGFSTRDEVSMVSGRGVGMDVVRANVEAVGGTVELRSVVGEGTSLRLRVPLTLAIMPALVVRTGKQSFALPQSALVELAIVPIEKEAELVTTLGTKRFLRLRDTVVPLVRLSELFGLEANEKRGYYVAIVGMKGRMFGLAVDDLLDPQEIVIRAVSQMMRGLHVYAGATLLSSGQLALVLDVNGIAELAQVKPIEQAQEVAELRVETPMLAAQQQLLVYEDMQGQRSALALTDVKRIDAVRSGAIERMGGRWLIEDKGRVLPVAGIDHLDHLPADELMTLILLREPAQALLVQRVLDIAAEDLMPAFSERGVTVSRVNAQLTMMPARVNALPEAA